MSIAVQGCGYGMSLVCGLVIRGSAHSPLPGCPCWVVCLKSVCDPWFSILVSNRRGVEDYFALFGFPRSFEVSLEELEKRYLCLQKLVHPDRYVSHDAMEKKVAARKSAVLNEAFHVLCDKQARGTHLVQLAGCLVHEDQGLSGDEGFLVEFMELREEIEEIRAACDEERRIGMTISLTAKEEDLYAQLAVQFGKGEFNEAKKTLEKACFFRKAREEMSKT